MRIIVQFVGQSIGVIYWHKTKPDDVRPYKMWLYPLPAIIGIIIWLFILFSNNWQYIVGATCFILTGAAVYFLFIEPQKRKREELEKESI